VILCDHASNRVPEAFQSFGFAEDALQTHIAWDPGALAVAQFGQRSSPASTNGCNFLEDPILPNHEPARDVLDEPFGLTVHTSPSRRMLLVSDTLGNRLLRIDLGPAPFLLASLLALAIAIGTIASHAIKVARANPILALRYE